MSDRHPDVAGVTEDEIRALVRAALGRNEGAARQHRMGAVEPSLAWQSHPSHGRLPLVAGGDGACLIEPTVRCNHCGYCQSYGH